ncbi:two-component system sensor histidine kinase VanS [Paenibacillus rhizosphaerae]|uniref:histidine kinase n=1 Tax=Paenibacillus rhizosphaerae TaxID=297318 RepID=A0A839TNG8_9BACL|nr:HAMP domain-containing sensor histidine kinase [Paenibacillus rhizosphaerae]MBB3128315.1 two-component system sensor histidine kinase VanS [Paenibacillus rhizosphaerae]
MNEKKFKIRLLGQMLLRFFILSVVSFALICVVVMVVFIWGDNPTGGIYHWIESRILYLAAACFVLCILFILGLQCIQLISYLAKVAGAVDIIGNEEQRPVELPSILRETQDRFNQVMNKIKDKESAAREAEQRKNDLVVYLAHDLKTPISSIIGYLTLLRDEKQISQEMHDRYVGVALKNSERLDDLINEFFEITRYNLSNITLEYSRTNLTRMLEQLVFELQPMLVEKNLTCRIEMPSDLELRCDADKIHRVFDNLIGNAILYSLENSEIQITASVSDTAITLNFMNCSHTISDEKLNRIFEQFYRLDASRSSRTGGSGLGLAIAKEIIERHQGRIFASSQDDSISFSVVLPFS